MQFEYFVMHLRFEEQNLWVLAARVQRKMQGSAREEITEDWRKITS
jgi:hypothetical protein